MQTKLFSIIVPIYKVEKYLHKCVNSLVNQTYKDIEIVLVDDGSPDNCPQICDEYAAKDKRIKVIHKKNGGLSDARNVGLKNCTGGYVFFVDSDDYIDLDACERLLPFIEKGCDVIVTDGIPEGGNHNLIHFKERDEKVYSGIDYIKKAIIKENMPMAAWLYVYRREYLIENSLQFKKGILHEDEQFTPRAILKAQTVINSGIAYYHYVIREGSITTQPDKRRNARDLYSTCLELEKIYDKLEDETLKLYLKDLLVQKYLSKFQDGKLYQYGKEYIKKDFVRENAFLLKTKLKARLFCFSPKLYWYINYLSKKIH